LRSNELRKAYFMRRPPKSGVLLNRAFWVSRRTSRSIGLRTFLLHRREVMWHLEYVGWFTVAVIFFFILSSIAKSLKKIAGTCDSKEKSTHSG
jgi:hypothetical protein